MVRIGFYYYYFVKVFYHTYDKILSAMLLRSSIVNYDRLAIMSITRKTSKIQKVLDPFEICINSFFSYLIKSSIRSFDGFDKFIFLQCIHNISDSVGSLLFYTLNLCNDVILTDRHILCIRTKVFKDRERCKF
jgi:ABC-type long-subunit fatty acid transport system fused permease/ATPase subunit